MADFGPKQSPESSACLTAGATNRCPMRIAAMLVSRYWFVLIAAAALIELGAWLWQTRPTMNPEQWKRVRRHLEKQLQPEDLVLAAPLWLDPIARMHLGDEIMTDKRVARSDESRFGRAFQLSWHGHQTSDTAGWKLKSEQSFGSVRVRELINPHYIPVIDDLVDHAVAHRLHASIRKDGKDEDCNWHASNPIAGNLGFGPATPQHRAHCPSGAWVGATINADTEYRPRRCIYAPPPGGEKVTALVFRSVKFGRILLGHHALYVEAERDRQGHPVTIVFSVGEHLVGRAVHNDGDGWSEFSFKTEELAGKTAPLEVTISSTGGNRRMYCFEATTR